MPRHRRLLADVPACHAIRSSALHSWSSRLAVGRANDDISSPDDMFPRFLGHIPFKPNRKI